MCEYCESPIHALLLDTGTLQAFVTTGKMLYAEYHGNSEQEYVEEPIHFCPMCGRDLRGDAS